MRVTIVCDNLGKPNNGTTIAALNLIDHLKNSGHEVRVVSPDENPEGKPGYYSVPRANLGRLPNKVLEDNGVSLAKPERSVLEQAIEGADVVHVLFPMALGWKAAKIACERGIPLTASFHCQAENLTSHLGLMNSKAATRTVYRLFNKKVYRRCTLIHYPTEFIRGEFLKYVHCSVPGRVISNGVNPMFFEREPVKRVSDKFTIICSGRFSREKAQHVLLEAVAGSKYRDDIKLVLAGCGPLEQKLSELAEKHGLDCDIGFYKREELAAMLRGAELYVHTAVAEIEAIACTEAIVSGLVPVICDSEGSATRFFAVDGRSLYKSGSAEDLRGKIEYYYEHPGERAAYKKLYAEKAKCFDQRECMLKMEQMLKDAASARSGFAVPDANENENEPAKAVSC